MSGYREPAEQLPAVSPPARTYAEKRAVERQYPKLDHEGQVCARSDNCSQGIDGGCTFHKMCGRRLCRCLCLPR